MNRSLRLLASALTVGTAFLAAGCHRSAVPVESRDLVPDTRPVGALILDRGDWRTSDQVGLWKAFEERELGKAPTHVGFLVLRRYREVRDGPTFQIYDVTRLDRNDQIGQIDGLGNATRFLPKRDGGIEVVKVGNSTLVLDVQAIFGTTHPMSLAATTERKLAFEALDLNHDGGLTKDEYPRILESPSADLNHDGKIDPQEFDAIDQI
jgi:hypothetical protein